MTAQLPKVRDLKANSREILRAAGEGVLLGTVVGISFGLAEARANQDFAHGMAWMALLRTSSALHLSISCGAVASILLRIFFVGLRGMRVRPALAGISGLLALGWAIDLMFSGPWQTRLDALSQSRGLQVAVLATVTGALAAMLVLRAHDGFSSRPRSTAAKPRFRILAVAVGIVIIAGVLAPELAFRLWALRGAPRPSVLLLSIDTLRADRLGRMTGAGSLTPHLDALADKGASFLNATAPSPWTHSSHASLFASRLPFDLRGKWGRHRVPPGVPMLAERFRDAGYRTAAFTGGGCIHGRYGFYQGFEVYESHEEIAEGGPGEILSGALDWLSRVRDRPYFLFVHTYEVHIPYTHADLADPGQAGRVGESFDFKDLEMVRSGEWILTAAEREYVQDLYDGDVAFADEVIGRFLSRVAELRPLDDTIVVVLSDHGEDLWDHVAPRSPDHGHSLYEELLRVPLILYSPRLIQAGLRVQTPVSLLDVAPTLLSIAGIAPSAELGGRDLSSTLRNGGEPPLLPVSAESVHYGPDRFSVRTGNLKVIVTPYPEGAHSEVRLEVEPLEVFDLGSDPMETSNLQGALDVEPSIMAALLDRAFRFAKQPPGSADRPPVEVPEELQQQLRALGYAGSDH